MKPNFALSLSADGIRLLHRAASGWHVVGQADVQSPGLADELAVLRSTASALEPGGVRCKLLIPDDQIRYLNIPKPKFDVQSHIELARAALIGATPYDVSELAFDVAENGEELQIAAVARETLSEAEFFAAEHRFHPVCFVASPNAEAFSGEPYFGETKLAAHLLGPGETIERDQAPVDLTSDVTPMAPQPAPVEEIALPEPVEEPLELSSEWEQTPAPEASFVSRRTVPTFRTQLPPPEVAAGLADANDAAVPGFEDPPAVFETKRNTRRETRQIPPAPPMVAPSKPVPAPSPVVTVVNDEADRLTVFGARSTAPVQRKTGSLGLGLAAVGVVFVGVIAFASTATQSGLGGIFARETTPTVQFSDPVQPQPTVPAVAEAIEQPVALASLERTLTDEDAAVLDALQTPLIAEPVLPAPPTEEELRADYAVTGIWPLAPEVPNPPAILELEDLYVTSIDPINQNFDAVALPVLQSLDSDISFRSPASPAPAGTRFALDENGLVIPTPNGSLNPDGVMIFAGAPPLRQPKTLLRIEDPGEDLAKRLVLAAFRPTARPADLIETTERATLDGLTRSELALFRPRLRPQSAQESARASASLVQLDNTTGEPLLPAQNENSFDGATARAVAASLRPDARPNNFSEIVARTQRATPPPATVSTVSMAPRTITPKIPSSASVSREATVKNAINLRQVNLIGVYGKPSSRRALVRLGNGRYRKVEVGDRIDGGLVSAIGDSELRYQKRGKAVVLKMPRG